MKIVKITEPREGFVYQSDEYGLISIESFNDNEIIFLRGNLGVRFKLHHVDFGDMIALSELKGKVDITHKRNEDGKLVEIPRDEIEVGDVFTRTEDNLKFCITTKITEKKDKYDHDEFYTPQSGRFILIDDGGSDYLVNYDIVCGCNKTGIMGVTHEIDWSK